MKTFASIVIFCLGCFKLFASEPMWLGFESSPQFNEQVRWTRLDSGVRIFVNARRELSKKLRRLVVYATPNGNTIEQTLGCNAKEGIDWHFQIQHVAAQIRALREIDSEHEWILAVVQAPEMSWPTFRRESASAAVIIHEIVRTLKTDYAAKDVVLSCHSGGGAFLWEYIAKVEAIPSEISRIIFLDANYSYSDDIGHGDRLMNWLNESAQRQLVVVAYDDREIELNGKKVIESDGGTWRASERMLSRFRRENSLTESEFGAFRHVVGHAGQLQFFLHRNPENKILHTALVGDMNGVLSSLTLGTPLEKSWGKLGEKPAFTKWIQEEPFVEPRQNAVIPADPIHKSLDSPLREQGAISGSEFKEKIKSLPREEREAAIVREVLSGNFPRTLKELVSVQVNCVDKKRIPHAGILFVMPDYLAIGEAGDSFRVPLSPNSAIQIADAFDASLITTKISDDIFKAATSRMEPRPLTKDRESVETFFEHHWIIESQLAKCLDKTLVAGIKKDVVFSNTLKAKQHRVAIYGWHMPDGRPIQPTYAGHVDWYMDYSHGIRLISKDVVVDGRPMKLADVLKDPDLCVLFSDEGVLDLMELRKESKW